MAGTVAHPTQTIATRNAILSVGASRASCATAVNIALAAIDLPVTAPALTLAVARIDATFAVRIFPICDGRACSGSGRCVAMKAKGRASGVATNPIDAMATLAFAAGGATLAVDLFGRRLAGILGTAFIAVAAMVIAQTFNAIARGQLR